MGGVGGGGVSESRRRVGVEGKGLVSGRGGLGAWGGGGWSGPEWMGWGGVKGPIQGVMGEGDGWRGLGMH